MSEFIFFVLGMLTVVGLVAIYTALFVAHVFKKDKKRDEHESNLGI